jgi:hypothetical protein
MVPKNSKGSSKIPTGNNPQAVIVLVETLQRPHVGSGQGDCDIERLVQRRYIVLGSSEALQDIAICCCNSAPGFSVGIAIALFR